MKHTLGGERGEKRVPKKELDERERVVKEH